MPRLTIKLTIENDVISETFRMLELSNAQLVNVCHCTRLDLIEFECFEFHLAYNETQLAWRQLAVPLSYLRPRGPHPTGEGPELTFLVMFRVALQSLVSRCLRVVGSEHKFGY